MRNAILEYWQYIVTLKNKTEYSLPHLLAKDDDLLASLDNFTSCWHFIYEFNYPYCFLENLKLIKEDRWDSLFFFFLYSFAHPLIRSFSSVQ